MLSGFSARRVLCTAFVGKSTGQVRMAITDSLAQIVRQIAVDYKAVLVPFDHLFADLQKSEPTKKYSRLTMWPTACSSTSARPSCWPAVSSDWTNTWIN